MSKIEVRGFPKTKNPKHSEKNYTKLAEARIIQKNLVYVIGLSSSLANKEVILTYLDSLKARIFRTIWTHL
jgi:hypothetical protein